MGEEETTDVHEDVDTADNGADEAEDITTEDDADTSKNTDADDAEADNADAEDSDDDSEGNSDDTSSSDTADDEADDEGGEDDGSEPELRKPLAGASNAEWAAWRKQQKDKSAENKKSNKGTDDNGEDGEDTDDALSPEDAAAIDKRIAKAMQPFQQKAVEQEVDGEIASFLANNPDFKPFAVKAKRFAMHPSRQNVPVKSIFYEVAGDKLLRIGAQRRAAADAKAKKTRSGGGSPSAEGGSKSYKDMPLEEFGKELDAVKTAPRR